MTKYRIVPKWSGGHGYFIVQYKKKYFWRTVQRWYEAFGIPTEFNTIESARSRIDEMIADDLTKDEWLKQGIEYYP